VSRKVAVKGSTDDPSANAGMSRRDRAQRTRIRMIRAAQQVFVERGYTGASMAEIAKAAGVAVQTVYFTFHTKGELLSACYDTAVLGEEDPRPPQQQPWYAGMLAARSGKLALRAFAQGNSTIVQRVGLLDDVVRSALHEPDAVAVRANSERLRRAGYANVVAHLRGRFGLRRGLDDTTATDLLLAFGGSSLFRSLVLDYGWEHDRYVSWLAETLAGQLLP
jgi:AcrR family transcriptional regulator